MSDTTMENPEAVIEVVPPESCAVQTVEEPIDPEVITPEMNRFFGIGKAAIFGLGDEMYCL